MSTFHYLEPPTQAVTLYPFTLMRAGIDLPVGLLPLREKWPLLFRPLNKKKKNLYTISSAVMPSARLCQSIASLKKGQSLFTKEGDWIATAARIDRIPPKPHVPDKKIGYPVLFLRYPWDLLTGLNRAVEMDFLLLTMGKKSDIPAYVKIIGKHPVFLAKGARLMPCFLNTESGPIYIGKRAEVQEGAMIRGPFLLGDRSVVKMGAKIYGPAVAGASCLLGGEIKRSLLFPFSNKVHDGYMGDSVIGSWCNWGAGTSNSNLKNTAGAIEVEVGGRNVSVGQKAGVFMGDHSRTVINSSLNSGTVIGVSVQVGNEGLPPKRISSFRWMDGTRYQLKQALVHIEQWKALKGQKLEREEIERLKYIFKTDQ
ncbi:MAG: hypothetical protein FJX92_02440 [Bacteroidetes bacterium]|nr:hypothetical protein [Bacteroidota bacterium]